MTTETVRTLERVAKKLGDVSDYKAAQALGVTRQAVSQWRNNNNYMNDGPAVKAAEILGERPETILALIAADRTDDPATKKIWTNLAKQLRATAAATTLAALGFTMFPSDAARSAETRDFAQSVYYVKYEVSALILHSRRYHTDLSRARPARTVGSHAASFFTYCFKCSVAIATSASLKISRSCRTHPASSFGLSTQMSDPRAEGLRLTNQSRNTTTPRTGKVLDVEFRRSALISATSALH